MTERSFIPDTGHKCVDCKAGGGGIRPRKIATAEGETPLCATHRTERKVAKRKKARASSVERKYDISADDNQALYVYQNGRCWICQKATGASKNLAVDHDHADDWVRGRLCSTCNQFIGRQLGDDPRKAERLMRYLKGDTPYRRLLAERWIRKYLPDYPPDPNSDVTVELTSVAIAGSLRITWLCRGKICQQYRELRELEALKS